MAEVRKVLGQADLAATTLTDVYTVPASTEAVISTVFVCNRSGANRTFRCSIAPNGAADSNEQYLYWDEDLGRGGTFAFTTGITLGDTDVLRVYASGADVSVNVFGVELT